MTLDDHDPLGHVIEDENSPRSVCPRFADDRFASGIDEKKFERTKTAREFIATATRDFLAHISRDGEFLIGPQAFSELCEDVSDLEENNFAEIDRQLKAAEKLP